MDPSFIWRACAAHGLVSWSSILDADASLSHTAMGNVNFITSSGTPSAANDAIGSGSVEAVAKQLDSGEEALLASCPLSLVMQAWQEKGKR